MKNFRDLKVWNKGYELVLAIYKLSRHFPSDEKFGLTQQIRRAAVSVIANIAEGNKRKSSKDFKHFLNISEGSLEEVKCYLILSRDLGYIKVADYNNSFIISEELGKMLSGFIKKLTAYSL
ncbi:MAG: four helix bundle protein [Candidatus Omnitrophica bacterium]|nr:four helix bundle protein [Candidatus Omnitrophota bacterium]MDD5430544.1 four helix bundle protein [Candidatus Omnitrophota bacterium]